MWEKLKQLHSYNAWILLLLFITGFALFIPEFRGVTADYRVSIKNAHIVIGSLMILILIGYLPFTRTHWKKIGNNRVKKYNLVLTLLFILSWAISGTVLVFERSLPAVYSQTALDLHDYITWFSIPVILYHIISRASFMVDVKRKNRESNVEKDVSPKISRRNFFKYICSTLLVVIIGPYVYSWMKKLFGVGGMSYNEILETPMENKMNPSPVVSPKSNPPIGGGLKGNFRAYTVTDIPHYTERNWYLQIDGLVDSPHLYNWEEFVKLTREVQVNDFHCVTGWSVKNITYEGIPLREILKRAGIQKNAKYVKFYSGDGIYTDALSLNQASMDDVMVAVIMDGKLIPAELGGPVRLIVPQMYAYKSVKWLVRIEVTSQPHLGYWQVRGYETDAWVRK
ncbi:molybdopterin-dependent oxidoreductase [Litchfieldia salsa]|uniref:Oxidoreductase molybdopterin binding domain-containing protein n=1 Tax=Litchfieldia salsa TaxID=930152 RepID=A0A1H0WY66_9BACI|nr:molybdopterin-dependent oxidoreductase [Litchfieldia salsa]SDP95375.1 Oxidoreductase molybdopterin binding domain-containing protein [Litchfieldia salsa]